MDSLELAPKDLAKKLSRNEVQLVDVREPREHAICAIPGDMLIPLGQLLQRLGEIASGKPVVLYCHTGGRSLFAARMLQKRGITAMSLAGGIDRWAEELDPSMERY